MADHRLLIKVKKNLYPISIDDAEIVGDDISKLAAHLLVMMAGSGLKSAQR
jgi:hypothetical protein